MREVGEDAEKQHL